MLSLGIIEEVTDPTDWCAPMVPVEKQNNEVRVCIDLKRLNKAVKRERYICQRLKISLESWLERRYSPLSTLHADFGKSHWRRIAAS
jgi:hypothetical protein